MMKIINRNSIVVASISCFSAAIIMSTFWSKNMNALSQAPDTIEKFNEIAVVYNQPVVEHLNKLTPQERIFIYYLFRASLPGYRIAADQIHRDALEIKRIIYSVIISEALIKEKVSDGSLILSHDVNHFLDNLKTYMVYIWANHGQYFARESSQEKRSPARLGLTALTKENLIATLKALGKDEQARRLIDIEQSIFDHTHESTATVPNSIEQSAGNIYSKNFTDADYQKLPLEQKDKINAYFYIDSTDNLPKMQQYAVGEKYGEELSVAAFWLQKAYDHAQQNPENFDQYLLLSLEHLIMFLNTGDEAWFKKHSIEWLKSSSTIDYNFGFVETYHDPKSKRGQFQAEATIKTIDLAKLNAILPSIEAQLPFPQDFKRSVESLKILPNASTNTKVFGVGGLGPIFMTAAYCLPNYEDIRETYGSKQIMYPSMKCLGALLNPTFSRNVFFLKKEAAWLEKHDQQFEFFNDLWDIHCILHETLGHGSGKLATHTFKHGESLTIGNTTYNVGDTIPVTSDNVSEFLQGYDHTIEELRAEIIALYVSITHLDRLLELGFFSQWMKTLTKNELKEWLLFHMADTGLVRLIQQSDDATEIAGDHARANSVIMNYLIASEGIALREEILHANNQTYTVLGLTIIDMDKAQDATTKLMQEVQRIKSTGDGLAAKNLVEMYGVKLNPHHLKTLKDNNKASTGDLKVRLILSPHMRPLVQGDRIVDIHASWPKNVFDQINEFVKLEMSLE